MKLAVIMVLFSISSLAASPDLALYNAATYGAEAKVCLRVVNQDGKPVPDATIKGGMTTGGGVNDYSKISGHTDGDGLFVIEGKCTDFIRCNIGKEGYYASEFKYVCYKKGVSPAVVDGKWQPYGSASTIVLKQILNPISLVCNKGLKSFAIPAYEEWIGFDCLLFDFTPPYGQGKDSDFMLRFFLKNKSREDYHMTMELSFTNNSFAGAYMAPKDIFSDFDSIYKADTNASFTSSFTFSYDKRPGTAPKKTSLGENHYLVFRTRTKKDVAGNLCSAHYGKVFGEWSFVGPGGMKIPFLVFNPTPNDTNLEDAETAEQSEQHRRQIEDGFL